MKNGQQGSRNKSDKGHMDWERLNKTKRGPYSNKIKSVVANRVTRVVISGPL